MLVSGVSAVWKDTKFFANQYRCSLDICLMTVLWYSYVIIFDREINAPRHLKNVVDGLNTTDK